MKNTNEGENIAETLEKCGISCDLTYEEIKKIEQEEIVREIIREQIKQEKAAQRANQPSAWSALSGIFFGPILFIVGCVLCASGIWIIGIFPLIFGALCFFAGIGHVIWLVLLAIGEIFNTITNRR